MRTETLELENKNLLEKRKHSFGPENLSPIHCPIVSLVSGFERDYLMFTYID